MSEISISSSLYSLRRARSCFGSPLSAHSRPFEATMSHSREDIKWRRPVWVWKRFSNRLRCGPGFWKVSLACAPVPAITVLRRSINISASPGNEMFCHQPAACTNPPFLRIIQVIPVVAKPETTHDSISNAAASRILL